MPIPYPRRGSTSASGAPPPTRTPSTDSYPSISSHAVHSDAASDSGSDATSSSSDDRDSEAEEAALIQAEWEESMRQLEMVVSIVLVPFFGKWYGRRWAFWAYDRYLHVGLGRAFLGLH